MQKNFVCLKWNKDEEVLLIEYYPLASKQKGGTHFLLMRKETK